MRRIEPFTEVDRKGKKKMTPRTMDQLTLIQV